MSAPLMTIDVDKTALVAAINRLGAVADRLLLEASRETGRSIAGEARRRMPKSDHPRWGSHLADHVQVQDHTDNRGQSVIVFVDDTTGRHPTNLDSWIEFGTRKMGAHHYLLPAAALEERAHLRRVDDAMQRAIAEVGLGG